jgi:hypothetical protein
VVTDAPADLTRHIQTNALGTTKTDVMWQARRDGREVAATRPSLSLHRPFPVAPETFYRFNNEHEDDDDNGRTLGSSPWFNPRGTLADDSYGDNHGAIDPLAGRHGVAERVAKVSSDARRAYEENELGSQLPRSAPPSAPSVLHPKIISATTGKNGVKRKTRPLHRAPDAADDELMAVVMKKVRQTKGKIWLTEDALGENPRESSARLAPTYKAAKQPLRPPHHPHHSSAARRPSADSCDTFLDPIEPYGSHRGSLSFGFGSEEDDDHDAIMNQCAAAAAAAHDHHDSFYGGNKPVNGDGDMTNGHTRDTFVDAVVAAVSIETERGRSIHSVPSTGTLQDRAEAEAEAEQHRAAARGGIASARPRLSVTRRVKTFAAAEDVVEIVGGNDCVSAERCVDLARYEEESVGEDNIGDDEEIEVATYASPGPSTATSPTRSAPSSEPRASHPLAAAAADRAPPRTTTSSRRRSRRKPPGTISKDSRPSPNGSPRRSRERYDRRTPGLPAWFYRSKPEGSTGPRRTPATPATPAGTAGRRLGGAAWPRRTRTPWRCPRRAGRSPSTASARLLSFSSGARARARRRFALERVRWCSAGERPYAFF